MLVIMEPGITKKDRRVTAVVDKATGYGLRTRVSETRGEHHLLTEVYLLDGERVRSCQYPEHNFRMAGVSDVRRITPCIVGPAADRHDPLHVSLGPMTAIGQGLPCVPIIGPCTVDREVKSILSHLAALGIRQTRGGCWKPRSNALSFRGFGRKAVEWLLDAAGETAMEAVFIEVLESKHIAAVKQIKHRVGYGGVVVLWVGARSAGNTELVASLGEQRDFPVLIKNGIHERGVKEMLTRVNFVNLGPMHWDEDGTLNAERSRAPGQHEVMLCMRGTEQRDPDSPFRFSPNHAWIETAHEKWFGPVGVDPSHSAGTMENDLVLRNLQSALPYRPDFALIEGGYDRPRAGFCDAEQSVPIQRIEEVLAILEEHNQQFDHVSMLSSAG